MKLIKSEETELTVGTRVKIEKGCKASSIDKNCLAKITEIAPLGAEYSHCVRVIFIMLNGFKAGKTFAFYARHVNRLSHTVISMNNGNPLNSIKIIRATA